MRLRLSEVENASEEEMNRQRVWRGGRQGGHKRKHGGFKARGGGGGTKNKGRDGPFSTLSTALQRELQPLSLYT